MISHFVHSHWFAYPLFLCWNFLPFPCIYVVVQHHTYTVYLDYSLPIAPQDVLNSCPSFEFIFCLQFALKFTVTYIFIVLLEYLLQKGLFSNSMWDRTLGWGWIA